MVHLCWISAQENIVIELHELERLANFQDLSLMNPSNTTTSADFNVDDSGDLLVTTTGRKYQFDGDIKSLEPSSAVAP